MSIDQWIGSVGGALGLVMTAYTAYNTVVVKRRKAEADVIKAQAIAEKERSDAEAQERRDKAESEKRAMEISRLKDEMNAQWLARYNAENTRLHDEIKDIRADMQRQIDELKADLVLHQRWVTLCNDKLMASGIPMVPKPEKVS